jgi:hypothetical protein
VEEVVRDMGFHECEPGNKLEVIEALLGDDGRRLLEGHAEDETALGKVIEDELEEDDLQPVSVRAYLGSLTVTKVTLRDPGWPSFCPPFGRRPLRGLG